MNFYFAGSIRAGREDAPLYKQIIGYLSGYGRVLTEHVGLEDVEAAEARMSDEEIFRRDVGWIKACNIFVAEMTTPSFGVGYETATAESLGKPVFLLFRDGADKKISAMAGGNKRVTLVRYRDFADLKKKLDKEFLVLDDLVGGSAGEDDG